MEIKTMTVEEMQGVNGGDGGITGLINLAFAIMWDNIKEAMQAGKDAEQAINEALENGVTWEELFPTPPTGYTPGVTHPQK